MAGPRYHRAASGLLRSVMNAVDWTHMWLPARSPWETVIRAAVVYLFVHLTFRIAGRRELGQHSAYDIVLLFFVGVAMRQTIVGADASLTTAMIGWSTLLAVDRVISKLVSSSERAASFIEGPVRELVRNGQVKEEELRRAHVSREQLLAALRHHGRERLDEVHRACLERSGHISFILADPRRPDPVADAGGDHHVP